MEQLKSLINVMEALSKDNDLKKYVLIGNENDGSTLLKVRFTKRNSNSENDFIKPVTFKRQSDKQTMRDHTRKQNNSRKSSETGYTTRSKTKNREEIEQPRLDNSAQSEIVPISPEMHVNNSVSVCPSNSSMCDSSSPPIPKLQSNGPVTTNTTETVGKIYAPTNFRNVVPINSLFEEDSSDHESDQKDFDDHTVPCLGCRAVRFPRFYCPDQRIYSCWSCKNSLFKKHDAECFKTHEVIFQSFDSIT